MIKSKKQKEEEEEDEEEIKGKIIKNIEDLPNLGPATAEKLRIEGYETIEKIAAASPYEIGEIADISVEKAKKAIEAAKKASETEYETAEEVAERRKNIGWITTGSKELNELLGGGIETQSITEFFGKFASGKSQIAFQVAVNVQLPREKGGLEGKALFIDTEASFRPDRIRQMTETSGLNPDEVLRNILVARAINSDHQMILVEKLDEIIEKENIKVVIIDSLTSHFRVDYIGRGALSERQQKLNRHVHTLQNLSEKYNIAILITNQVMANPAILFGDPTTPIGGHVLAHASGARVYVRKGKAEKRIARLIDSPNLPEGECVFKVTPEGIKD